MKRVRILPAVLLDIAEAAAWYDENGYDGLGDRFVDTFYGSLDRIQRDGAIHRTVYQNFRRILIRPFPYSVFYQLHDDEWIVTLVIHATRQPGLMKEMLENRK